MDDLKFIKDDTAKRFAEIADMNQKVWSYAEADYAEFKSAELEAKILEDNGFKVERGIADMPTAFMARYGSGHPVIGITAEYDALPGLSNEKGVAEHKPIPGQTHGHGCGHCALGAGAVGAALMLKDWLDEAKVPGTIELYGTPAEENGFGKSFMAKAGCFDGLDCCINRHPNSINSMHATKAVGYYVVRFTFKGVSAHAAAAPEMGRSALDAVELMNVGANYLREHLVDKARMHYAYLDAGGEAPNVVQSHASVLYYLRAPKLSYCDYMLARMKDMARGAALMTGTQETVEVLGGLCDVIPNATLAQVCSDAFVEIGGPDFDENDYAIARTFLDILPEEEKAKVIKAGAKENGVSEEEFAKHPLNTKVEPFSEKDMDYIMTGSTDLGDVSYKCPMVMMSAATCIPGTSMHSWQHTAMVGTSIGDKGAACAARAMAYAATRIYRDPAIAEKAKEELFKVTEGKFVSPIPDGMKPGTGINS